MKGFKQEEVETKSLQGRLEKQVLSVTNTGGMRTSHRAAVTHRAVRGLAVEQKNFGLVGADETSSGLLLWRYKNL